LIDLYTYDTSNGHRASIALEECGLPYRVQRVDLMKGEQRSEVFLKINPAGTIPVIVDPEGPDGKPFTLSQSAAIALYAAEKTGRYLPRDLARRTEAMKWVMFTVSDCAAASMLMFFEAVLLPEKVPANAAFAEQRFVRFVRVAEQRLAGREWLADELSIADFSLYPVCAVRQKVIDALDDVPNLRRWMAALAARDGVQRGIRAAAA
jgi:GST-like protein